jgi:hypothetical protein
LDKICAFAKAIGYTLFNPKTLCLQIKTSWIEVDTLAKEDRDSYIQMNATIPKFEEKSDYLWYSKGSKGTKLALVGIHISGSVKGHPEMIWASFEHFGNTPNATYQYHLTDGSTKIVCQDTTGAWLFCTSGATGDFNQSLQKVVRNGPLVMIRARTPAPIGPSDILRIAPFGASLDKPDAAASNTQIISMNNSVRGQLAAGDMRRNYFMLGATWTDGNAPDDTNQMGTSHLANSTMETFQQNTNCLACHNNNGDSGPRPATRRLGRTPVTMKVSHVFDSLESTMPDNPSRE